MPKKLAFLLYSGLLLRGRSDVIERVITMTILELATLAAVWFLLSAAEVAVSDFYTESLRFDHVAGGMLFWLPNVLVSVLSHPGSYRIAKRMCTYPVRVSWPFLLETEIDWFSSGGSNHLFS